jgi:glycolate dehydrogenase iron-sulfur subunit
MTVLPTGALADALEAQRERLLPCVHCGFCLPACPTYNRLGDENDSPRGRLHLMKAVVEGRLDPASSAFQTHIDRCLGCRACEPVCPSGVEYGTLLELARDTATDAHPPGFLTRALLVVMGSRLLRSALFLGGRILRATGLAGLVVRLLPQSGRAANLRLAFAMLASSAPLSSAPSSSAPSSSAPSSSAPSSSAGTSTAPEADPLGGTEDVSATGEPDRPVRSRASVAVLSGCVQAGLYGRINEATARTLAANGYDVTQVAGQDCCGALHAHGGDLAGARRLARRNVEAFEVSGVDLVAVNAAGCGAAMKEYGTLFERDPDTDFAARARAFAEQVRDVTELLAEAGPRTGAAIPCSVAYDHPCHLLHAQGVSQAPFEVLGAVPGVDVRVIDNADECCGGAGIYGMTHPELGGRIGDDKVAAVRAVGADLACTPNPGCMMQIGAGLRMQGESGAVVHPVELLDRSYEKAGYY